MKIDEKLYPAMKALYAEFQRALEEIKALGFDSGDHEDSEGTCVIIDSEKEAAMALGECLAARGLKVWTASSGNEGLRVIRQVRPALILTDLKPEGLGGLSLLARIRRFSPGSRIIILTGWTFPYAETVLREFQIDAYFVKPVSLGIILRVVEKTLGDLSPVV